MPYTPGKLQGQTEGGLQADLNGILELQVDLGVPRPLSLGLVAWEAYSDWVLTPSPVAGVLMSLRFPCLFMLVSLHFGCILYHWLPPCYFIEISGPVL